MTKHSCRTCKRFKEDLWCVECNYELRLPANVVEVVRCHECKYYRDKSYCFIDGRETIEGDDYCSWGERAKA